MKKHIKIIVSSLLLILLIILSVGCGNKNKKIVFEPEVSSVYVCDDGTLLCAMVEDFAESYYDIDELKTFVAEQVVSFNEEAAGISAAYDTEESEADDNLPIAIKDCYTLGDKAVLILSCTDYKNYYEINKLEEYVEVISSVETTTIKNMKSSDESFDTDIFKADGTTVDINKVLKKNKYHVVKVSGTGVIEVQGVIKYVSANVVVNDDASAAEVSGDVSYIIYK